LYSSLVFCHPLSLSLSLSFLGGGGLLSSVLIDFCLAQARGVSTDGLRPCFYAINVVVYAIQVKFRLYIRTDLGNKLTVRLSLKYCGLTH